eukprot:c18672_g1_i1 orf=205-1080(+)
MQGRLLSLISRRLQSSTSHVSSLRKFTSSGEEALIAKPLIHRKSPTKHIETRQPCEGNLPTHDTQNSASPEELFSPLPNPRHSLNTNPTRDASLPQVENCIWAVERLGKGKWYSGHDRKKDRIPGYVWEQDASDVEHVLIVLDRFQIQSLRSRMGEERFLLTVFTLEVFDGLGSQRILYKLQVLPRRINYDKGGNICNVGFAKVPLGAKLRLDTPIRISGQEDCIGLKKGGRLKVYLEYASLFCSPEEIPPCVDIDVNEMDIGDSICLGDLKFEVPLHESNQSSQVICEII